jgi:hypothetical protein
MTYYIVLGVIIYFFKTLIMVILMTHDEGKRQRHLYHADATPAQSCPVFHDDTRNCPYLRK